ncbi:MAG: hypothetical protein JWQ37_178, partial [Blastococcus sp.]|nr:hypothetical protein [Blastococcus sp.]
GTGTGTGTGGCRARHSGGPAHGAHRRR